MNIFASKLSENMKRTPEGYLLCLNVPIARTGLLEYSAEELPGLEADGQGIVRVYRDADALFHPDTIASFEGKPLTLQHPDDKAHEDFVYPDNWKEHSRGTVNNVRRGLKNEDDLLFADFLVMDKEIINAILQYRLRDVSCGYNAEYEVMGKGLARQVKIRGNHVAIVDNGRCGNRCAVKDHEKDLIMAKKTGFLSGLFKSPKVLKALDEAAEELEKGSTDKAEENKDSKQPATDDASAAILEKLDEVALLLRSLLEKSAGDSTEDNKPATDKEPTADDDQDKKLEGSSDTESDIGAKKSEDEEGNKTADSATVNRANLLAPHLSARIGDSAAALKKTSLRHAMADAGIARVVTACLGKDSLDTASLRTLDSAFVAAAEVKKSANNHKVADGLSNAGPSFMKKQAITPASINEANRKHYDRKGS